MNWRCAANSAALLLLGAAASAAAAAPLITRGPYIVDASSVAAKVCWRAGSGDDYCRQIAGIPAGAAFKYELPGVKGGDWTGKTLSPYWDPIRFGVFGDAGDGSASQLRVSNILASTDLQFALMTGDIVYPDGTDEEYDSNYFRPYALGLASMCFFPAPGNHDYGNAWLASSGRRRFNEGYRRVFRRPPYYSFDAGPAHFVSIDDNEAYHVGGAEPIGPGSAQLRWLERDLAASQAPWKIVFMHVPLYSTRKNHGDNAWLRKVLQPVFEKTGVTLAFAGHEHLYNRSKPIGGVTYITAGTGGAKLDDGGGAADWLAQEIKSHGAVIVDLSETAIQAVFFDDDGRARDVLKLTRPAPAPQEPR